jgi:hypothetical protein
MKGYIQDSHLVQYGVFFICHHEINIQQNNKQIGTFLTTAAFSSISQNQISSLHVRQIPQDNFCFFLSTQPVLLKT